MTVSVTREQMRQNVFHHTLTVPISGELRSPGAAFKRHPHPISTAPILSKPGFPFHPNQTGKKPYNLMYVSIQLGPIPP